MRSMVILLLMMCLTSCGFHLRGQIPLSPPLQTMYLKTKDPYGQLARNLRQFLKLSGVYLTETPENATTIFEIVSERTLDQLISLNGSQQTRQYNLTLTVTFVITDPKGQPLIKPEALSETRVLTIKEGQILAGSNEATALYEQMRQAIVYDILSRLSSAQMTRFLTKNTLPYEAI